MHGQTGQHTPSNALLQNPPRGRGLDRVLVLGQRLRSCERGALVRRLLGPWKRPAPSSRTTTPTALPLPSLPSVNVVGRFA